MKKILSSAFTFLVFVFLYAPIVVLIIYSFNSGKSRAKWEGFTFEWYGMLFHDSNIMNALYVTLWVAFLSAIIATVIGTVSAYGIYNMKNITRTSVMNITYLPVLNPDIVTGVSLLILYIFLGMHLGFVSLLISHIVFNIPYVILSVLPKFRQMNSNIYEAALDLGAHPVSAFCRVVLPEIMPGVISGFLIALTLSIDDFVISFFTTGPGISTLSVTIYSMARKGIKPELNALSSMLFVSTFVLLFIINYITSKDNSNKLKEGNLV